MVSFQKKLRKTYFLSLTKLVHMILLLYKPVRKNYTGLPDFLKSVFIFFSFCAYKCVLECVYICHLHAGGAHGGCQRVEKGVGFLGSGVTGRCGFLDVGSPLLPSLKQQVLFPLTHLSSSFTFYLCIFKMSF